MHLISIVNKKDNTQNALAQESTETETIKFLAIFVKIKQRVLRENKNHHQYMMSSR